MAGTSKVGDPPVMWAAGWSSSSESYLTSQQASERLGRAWVGAAFPIHAQCLATRRLLPLHSGPAPIADLGGLPHSGEGERGHP